MPLTSNYPPFYGSSTPFTQGRVNPAVGPTIARGAGDFAQTTYALGALRGLRGLGATTGRDWLTLLATVAGAAVGGGLVGYVAADRNTDGAQRGAAFSAGLTGVANGFGSLRTGSPLFGAVSAASGLGAMWWSLAGKPVKLRKLVR